MISPAFNVDFFLLQNELLMFEIWRWGLAMLAYLCIQVQRER